MADRGGGGGGRGRGRGGGGRGFGSSNRGRGGGDRRGGRQDGDRRIRDEGRAAFQRRQREERSERSSNKRQRTDDNGEVIKEEQRKPRPLAEGEVREERKPKKKVAVLIGYCGTGYKGMQLNPPTKTIEGDLFEAFVKAGAISRDNSDDPRKSSLVRCARTDKGVHAAGNLISLKLIIEDPNTIANINAQLVPQIRVWDIVQTTGGFSCYQLCDSRKYEYLVPSHCFLPPHPSTTFGRKLRQAAEEEGDSGWEKRMEDVKDFWANTIDKCRKELEGLGFEKDVIEQQLLGAFEEDSEEREKKPDEVVDGLKKAMPSEGLGEDDPKMEDQTSEQLEPADKAPENPKPEPPAVDDEPLADSGIVDAQDGETPEGANGAPTAPKHQERVPTPEQQCRKLIKSIYIREKQAYRINPTRLATVRAAFKMYEGTNNFHNFTVQKRFNDPSAKRNIRSFVVEDPIIINNTEWISLRVHGQSFMMHQIRKMVGLVMLVVRSGCELSRITDLYGPPDVPIPKAPSLGLLLDHPIFEVYNKKAEEYGKKPLEFSIHEEKITKFKQEFIYDKLFEDEQQNNIFNGFLAFLDHFQSSEFDYLTSKGMKAVPKTQPTKNRSDRAKEEANGRHGNKRAHASDSDDDDEDNVDS